MASPMTGRHLLSIGTRAGLTLVAAWIAGSLPAEASWSEAMSQLRERYIDNSRARSEAAANLRLHELDAGAWYRFELSLFGTGGREVWPTGERPLHDYRSPLEARFGQEGVLAAGERYISSVKEDGGRVRATFQRVDIRDDALWPSPHRFRNRAEYYWRTIQVATPRPADLFLGFSEGCKVFLNGEEIFAELASPARKAIPGQARARLDLRKGTNHLLLKLTSWRRHPSEHESYVSFNPVPRVDLKGEAIRLFSDFPYQSDWFMQDLDRLADPPRGADLNADAIPKNMVRFCKGDRGTQFEETLIRRVLAEVRGGAALQSELDLLTAGRAPENDRRWLDLYAGACRLRRTQRLAGVRAASPKILFIKRHMLRPSFYGYTEGLSCANFERNFVPGSSLCLLELGGDRPKVTELLRDDDGTFRDIDVSWDGQRILFAWKKSLHGDDYHLYEMHWPDRSVRQLTFGIGVADFEGRYLPNDDLVFSSTRCIGTTDCWTTEVSNLHTCDRDGRYLRRLGYDQVVTCHPSVLDSGQVIYTRWDYNDRGQVFPQPLFQMSPDGTGQTEYYGNNSWFPTVINHARGIPGTDRVLAVLHGHHTWQAGELAVIDRSRGTQEAAGVQLIAPVREARPLREDRYGQGGNLHRHPYPLSENAFLVAMTPYMVARNEGERLGLRFHLYWMDSEGRREMLVRDPTISCAHPVPLKARRRPHVRPSLVDHRVPHGTYYMQDVYEGPGLRGAERGSIRKLRVVELEYRALKIGSNTSAGPGGGAMASSPISTGNGAWDVKRILGEAKVHEDGSALFKVPAHTPVYFQAIDANGSMAQTMRSWSTLMPNETLSCVGCHEDKRHAPPPARETMATRAGPQELTPFYGPARGFSFLKEIQPILDARCVSCHDGSTREQEKLLMDLTGTPYRDHVSKRDWSMSYLNLTHSKPEQPIRGDADHDHLNWVSAQSVPSMIPPYARGSATSGWFKMLREGHGEMTREELDTLAAWIDLGVPFCGDYVEANAWNDEEFKHYLQMQRKRERFSAEAREGAEALIEKETGEVVSLPAEEPRFGEYATARGVGSAAFDAGYRNLALNPEVRDDAWVMIDLGKEHEVDKVVITIRADAPHDGRWESGRMVFSDGSSLPFELKPRQTGQTISFPRRRISWVKFTDPVPADPRWWAFTDVAIWGTDTPGG